MQKPFDVNSIMDGLDETLVEEAYDTPRTSTVPFSETRRGVNIPNSGSSASRPENNPPSDPINPAHYRSHPSGIECIEITRHMNFNVGNAMKYIWRYMDKGDPVENLKKAQWYLDDEIRRLEGQR